MEHVSGSKPKKEEFLLGAERDERFGPLPHCLAVTTELVQNACPAERKGGSVEVGQFSRTSKRFLTPPESLLRITESEEDAGEEAECSCLRICA